jgi:cytochrome c553
LEPEFMTRTWRYAFVAATVVLSATALAQEAAAPKAAAPDLAKAKQIATQVCAACHGADGNSALPANPNLAGQIADYITLQLAHFKAGIRVNPTMQAMAATLSDADMQALGVYFSQQKPKGLAAKDAAQVKAGERGADKAGKDVNGRVMATIAGHMTDDQMKAVADYAMGLREAPSP